jgi:phage gpG-like protein
MKEFGSIGAFVREMTTNAAATVVAERSALRDGAEMIQHEAKAEIGIDQDQPIGPFPSWDPLSDATLYGFHHAAGFWIPGKVDLGYSPPDNSLLREGDLQDSIEVTVREGEAEIGSNSDIAIYQELGTPDALYPIPPRSFLGRGAATVEHKVVDAMVSQVVMVLAGVARPNR